MSKRRKRSVPIDRTGAPPSSGHSRWLLYLLGIVVLAVVAIVAYFRSQPGDFPSRAAKAAIPLELPTQPDNTAADQLREEAEQVVGELTERFPQSSDAHRTTAILYQFLHQYERVTDHWERCIALDPTDAAAREWLAKAQLKQGEDNAAVQTLQSAIDAGLNTAEIHHQYAVVLQRQGQLAKSEKVAQQALERYPKHLDLWIALGQAQVQLGKLADAKASFDSALQIDAKSSAAHFAAANVCLRLGHKEEAAAHRQMVETSQAVARSRVVSFDESYERSMRDTVAGVFSTAAAVYDENGDREHAKRLCLRACAIQPESPDPYRQLANLYQREGNLPAALQVQERLTAIEPDNEANHLNLSSLFFQMGRFKEGEAKLIAAAQAAPTRAIFPEALAIVYQRNSQFAEARSWAEQTVRLEPSAPRYRLLAEICQRLGDSPAAEAALQAATRFASSPSP